MRNLLVTGGAGFIGSNFVHYMLEKYDYQIIVFDQLTYAGRLENLERAKGNPRFAFVCGDRSPLRTEFNGQLNAPPAVVTLALRYLNVRFDFVSFANAFDVADEVNERRIGKIKRERRRL